MEKTRVQFDLSPNDIRRLDELKEITEASSRAEVIRKLIREAFKKRKRRK